ncbi:MAG: hypothetical protein FJX02_07940 [Alphaproteobacteria bacterium]|nr:hypothetical protein [Alphaproteobacteria bacterium]
MPRFHPFTWGHVGFAMVLGGVGGGWMSPEMIPWGVGVLGLGSALGNLVAWWRPGLDGAAWKLYLAATLGNPLMPIALGIIALESRCRPGLECLLFGMALLLAGALVVPALGGLIVRWIVRRRG